jgi:maleylpyruvate isomerase
VAADPLILVDDVRSAGERLLRRAATLDDGAVAGASRLPGWSRGHVLTHVARNADGVVNLLTWARTGTETPQYPSLEHRAADIEAGAGRSAAEQLADLTRAETRMLVTFEAMPANAWATEVRWADGRTGPAALIPWKRLREVELHHVDLDAGYGPGDWTEAFAVRMAAELAHGLGTRADAPRLVLRCPEVGHDLTFGERGGPVIAGDVRTAVAWLSGRGDGAGLTGPLPVVPPFG